MLLELPHSNDDQLAGEPVGNRSLVARIEKSFTAHPEKGVHRTYQELKITDRPVKSKRILKLIYRF